MSMSDPIADMLTRIRNALMVRKKMVEIPASKLKKSLLKIFEEEGYIKGFSERKVRENISVIDVKLKYHEGRPAIFEISKVSRPGQRIYKESIDLPQVKGGLGVAVISTSKGLMTDAKARQSNLGGEVLCYLY